jgi:cell division protein FtsX
VAEGTLIGGLGAVVSLLALWAIYGVTKSNLIESLQLVAGSGEVRFLGPSEGAFIVLSALVIGGLTGTVVSRAVR